MARRLPKIYLLLTGLGPHESPLGRVLRLLDHLVIIVQVESLSFVLNDHRCVGRVEMVVSQQDTTQVPRLLKDHLVRGRLLYLLFY